MSQVILVNNQDEPIGTMDKLEVHQKGLLHRAFSIFIFNATGEMLLQQRATEKYHSGGLWTNACCSHPLPGEKTIDAAHRRLKEELGFDTDLLPAFQFTYKADFENGLTEHEFDHVFIGQYEGDVQPDPAEVKEFTYIKVGDINKELQLHPEKYTAWFAIAFPKLESYLASL